MRGKRRFGGADDEPPVTRPPSDTGGSAGKTALPSTAKPYPRAGGGPGLSEANASELGAASLPSSGYAMGDRRPARTGIRSLTLTAALLATATTPLAARDTTPTHTPAKAVAQLGDAGGGSRPSRTWTPAFARVHNNNRVTPVDESRRVTLPKGRAVLRFEGVAGGIIPVSAVVDGLPGGTVEKNRDARVLSPAALVDGTLGNRVTLRRTDRRSGVVREEEATILSGPTGGVVVRTPNGVEALGCAGLADSLKYARIPANLAAKPVLSVTTDSPARRTVTVRLSYLATGFDWSASYVGTLRGDRLDLFAWTTLANGNAEGFANAEVQVVAGRLNRARVAPVQAAATRLQLRCYPLGTTTSDLRTEAFEMADEIIVTASRWGIPPPPPPPMMAVSAPAPPAPPAPENLGDVKLYRIPGRTTVAARGQKQVALLRQEGVAYSRIYRRRVGIGQRIVGGPVDIVLRVKNEKADGLGVPLPAGTTALYAPRGDTSLLVGTGTMTDRAEGETLLIGAGTSRQVLVTQTPLPGQAARLRVTNARKGPVDVELPIGYPGAKVEAPGLERIDGIQTWRVTVAPGDTATLDYRF